MTWEAAVIKLEAYKRLMEKNGREAELNIDVDKVSGKKNKQIFEAIYKQKVAIEKEFGGALEWERLDNERCSRIRKNIKMVGWLTRRVGIICKRA